MFWLAVGILISVYLICECVAECVKQKYFWQDSKCECDDCPMRYECRGCNK